MANTLPQGKPQVNPQDIYRAVIFTNHCDMDIKAKTIAVRRANLRTLIDSQFGGRQVDFANAIGRQPDYISRCLSGVKNLGEKLARDIEFKLGLEPHWLDRERGGAELEPGPELPRFFKKLPVVGTAQLGVDGYWTETGYPVGIGEGYVEFVSRDPNAYVLRVRGNSMAPAIKGGNLVVVEPNAEPIPGEYAVVCTRDGRCAVKEYLYRRDGEWHFRSVNDAYDALVLADEDIEKVHPVSAVVSGSKLKPW